MLTLEELRNKKKEIIEKLQSMLDAADSEKRDLTEDEEKEYTELDNQLPVLDREITRREKLEAEKAKLEAEEEERAKQPVKTVKMAATYKAENDEEFKSFGEFLFSVRFKPGDKRLEYREQSMGVGAQGGFMVPTQFIGTLLSVDPQEAIFRPRCRVIPAGSPPDAEVTMPALDQSSGSNMYGGFEYHWISEGKTKPETDISLREISLRPHEIAAYTVITDKLLRNWAAAEATLAEQARMARTAAEDNAFFNGSGVGQPLGILNSPARIDYARATANAIGYADIAGMYARGYLRGGGAWIWIASQTIIPQLAVIQDAASRYIWVESAASGLPPSLFGIPVLFNDRSPALGAKGDLCLVKLNYYLIKDGSGPFVEASPHVRFLENKTVIKFHWNVDGQPWLAEPIPLEGSTANTVSPFVILN